MSVLVRGMEMPENCMDCKIKQYDEYEDDCICPFSGVMCLSIGRQDACPLVEVPTPHGRLIDADRLKADNPRHMDADVPYVTEVTVEEIIDDAPTVIEAEVEE